MSKVRISFDNVENNIVSPNLKLTPIEVNPEQAFLIHTAINRSIKNIPSNIETEISRQLEAQEGLKYDLKADIESTRKGNPHGAED